MPLTENQKRQLRKLGHTLKPVVMIGANGLTEGVVNEIDLSLEHHELIKVKVGAGDRDVRDEMITGFCDSTRAELVQRIGNIALIFRRNTKQPKIHLEK